MASARGAASSSANDSGGSGKCKECRNKRRVRCVTPPGASKCKRCAMLGLLCVMPLDVTTQEVSMTPGECCRELSQPTNLHRPRQAASQLLDYMGRRVEGGELSNQVLGILRFLMHRAQASNDVALLHAAVSLSASLRVEGSMSSLAGEMLDPERTEALVAEANEHLLGRFRLDGIDPSGLATVQQIVHGGKRKLACNDRFKEAFFDIADVNVVALYYDLSLAIVDDESKEELKAMDERIVEAGLFEAGPLTRSGMFTFAVTSELPMVLVGRIGERLVGTLHNYSAWTPDGSVTVTYVAISGLQRPKGGDLKGEVQPTSLLTPRSRPPAAPERSKAPLSSNGDRHGDSYDGDTHNDEDEDEVEVEVEVEVEDEDEVEVQVEVEVEDEIEEDEFEPLLLDTLFNIA